MAFRLFKTEFVYGTTYPSTQEGTLQLFTDFIDSFANDANSINSGWSYDITHCPEKKPILLTPTVRTYAAFLVHRTGAKLMIAHSRYGVRDRDVSQSYYDIGFIGEKTYQNANDVFSDTGSGTKRKYVGLMSSFISASSVNDGYDFNPSASIRTADFYNSRMTKIVMNGCVTTTSTSSSTAGLNVNSVPYPCLAYTSGAVGEWFILCDSEKAAVGIGMKRKLDDIPCLYFIGDLSDDVSFSAFDAQILIMADYLQEASSNTPSSFNEGACNHSAYITGCFGTSRSGNQSVKQQTRLAFPYIMNRTKAALPYASNCVFDSNLFGYIPQASSITNQTFNNGAWLTLSSGSFFTVTDAYRTAAASNAATYVDATPIIAWDKVFNGSNVI